MPGPDPDPVPVPVLFDHERLDVYRAAIDFVRRTRDIVDSIANSREHSRSGAYLIDQLQRAASSIVLNIAEGAGEFSPGDKARFYRMALRSATECAAVLDVAKATSGLPILGVDDGRAILARIVAMLTRMVAVQKEQRTDRDRERDRDRDRT